MTNLELKIIEARQKLELAKKETASVKPDTRKKAKENAKKQAVAQQENKVEQLVIQELTENLAFGKYKPITNFFDNLDGAKRLYNHYLKKWNNFGDVINPQSTDREDLTSEIYTAICEYEIQEDDDIIENLDLQAYWGITTWQQYRKGRNAFTRLLRKNRQQSSSPEFDQDFGKAGTKSEVEEREFEIFLKAVLSEEGYKILHLMEMGYNQTEISKTLKMGRRDIFRFREQIKIDLSIIYGISLEDDTEE